MSGRVIWIFQIRLKSWYVIQPTILISLKASEIRNRRKLHNETEGGQIAIALFLTILVAKLVSNKAVVSKLRNCWFEHKTKFKVENCTFVNNKKDLLYLLCIKSLYEWLKLAFYRRLTHFLPKRISTKTHL